MRIKVKSSELGDANVTHVSLVERGANRVPFKIIKSETDKGGSMFNLNLKKAETKATPQLMGVLVSKEAATEGVVAALKAAGLKVDERLTNEDGAVLFKQAAFEEKDAKDFTVMKLSDEVAIALKGFDPYGATSAMSFKEILKAQGFMPGFSMATDAVYTSLRNILSNTGPDESKDMVSKIETTLKEFTGYVVELAKQIPAVAFKAEAEVSRVLAEAQAEEAEKAKKGVSGITGAVTAAATYAAQQAAAALEEDKKKNKNKNKDKKKKSVTELLAEGADDAAILAEHDDLDEDSVKEQRAEWTKKNDEAARKAQTDSIVAALGAQIAKAVEPLTAQVTQVAADVTAMKETVGKHDKALKSITVGGGSPEDLTSRKQEKDTGSLGQIDTAYNKVRKTALGTGMHVRRGH